MAVELMNSNYGEECLGRFDEYGDNTAIIEVFRYRYQGTYFIKAVRTLQGTDRSKNILNIPEYAAKDLAKIIIKGCCSDVKSALIFID